MGWGITFTPEIYLNRMSFNSVEDVKDKIEEEKEMLEYFKEKMLILVVSNPSDIIIEEYKDEPRDTLFTVQREFKECYKNIEEQVYLLSNLELLLQHVEENPGFNLKAE